ncbi:MAG: SET domain-containing protein [Burkholderiales bacterium]
MTKPSPTVGSRVRSKKSQSKKSSKKPSGRLFVVRRSGIHGKGGFALQTIPKGTRLVEYKGEIITWATVNRRYPEDDDDQQNHTFLFEVDDKRVIDANVGGNSARWINHSCTPNCEAVGEDDRIFIESIKPIRAGEELLYDYNIQLPERHTPTLKRQYLCYCGTRKCRGTILGKKG